MQPNLYPDPFKNLDQFSCCSKNRIFPQTKTLFDGESEGLSRIYATNTVRVPRPIKVIDFQENGAVLAIEYLDIKRGLQKYEAALGRSLGL